MTSSEEFERLAAPLRTELVAYCYRMTGSANEAEDLAQETYLRAWRSYGTFEGRSSLRTWLYRIATNVCLNAIGRQEHRPLPSGLEPPADDPGSRILARGLDVPWLEPFPGPAPGTDLDDPALVMASRAGLRLALIAALQCLPARQRAVLILRDVLEFPAADTARLLGMTQVAVNSALRRARSRLEQVMPDADAITEPDDRQERELASRYAAAFQDGDLATLVSLLRDDVALEMPPLRAWFSGIHPVARFLGTRVLAPGRFTLIPVVANGQAAFACYLCHPDGSMHAHGIQVLDIAGAAIARITIFLDQAQFEIFGLPVTVPAAVFPAMTTSLADCIGGCA
jgi:RNA polymerase sigma-70 factor, ECF subfamily